MTSAFDNRIVKVSLEFEDGISTFEGLAITANGRKYNNEIMNECQCNIYNLTKDQRNYILRRTSPLLITKTPIKMMLDVGRESYGTFRLFNGMVNLSNTTQPPDIGLSLFALTNSYAQGIITGSTQAAQSSLKTIAQSIATANGLTLDFDESQVTDKQIENFSHSGSVASQIKKLNEIGNVIAFIDNETLILLDSNKTKKGEARIISAATGMVGIPTLTQNGVIVKMMLDNSVELGSLITVQSEMLPPANGDYKVIKIDFEVASREPAFWYTLECQTLDYYLGTV